MSLTSAPVVPCSCADGWKPEGWAYCSECYDGQIERLRTALAFYADANNYASGDINVRGMTRPVMQDYGRQATAALAVSPSHQESK